MTYVFSLKAPMSEVGITFPNYEYDKLTHPLDGKRGYICELWQSIPGPRMTPSWCDGHTAPYTNTQLFTDSGTKLFLYYEYDMMFFIHHW